jgi:sugar/nucleoside kinase (ribokinase family)
MFVGRSTLDLVYFLDKLPDEDTKVFAQAVLVQGGGPALNAAITHAHLGGAALLVTAIGSGPWSGVVRGEIDAQSVSLIDLAAVTSFELPLSTVLVNRTAATRTIVNAPLSQQKFFFDVEKRESEILTLLGEMPIMVLCDGYLLEETLPLLISCNHGGAAICLDGGSWKPGMAQLAPFLSVAICSERFLVPKANGGMDETMDWFIKQGVPHVAVTRGSRSILACDRGRRFEVPVSPVVLPDTLGAGDILHGAFCHYFSQGMEFEKALGKAAEIATLSCSSNGTRAWMTQTALQRNSNQSADAASEEGGGEK